MEEESPSTNNEIYTKMQKEGPLDNQSLQKLRVLGVCGGIGSGKSTACKLLVSEFHCFAYIEADVVAHEVYRPGSPALKEIVEAFQEPELLLEETGELNRPKLGSIVFANRNAMKQLERIVWPYTEQRILERIQALQTEWEADVTSGRGDDNNEKLKVSRKRPIVIVEAAVLLDAGWQDSFLDGVWVVSVSDEVASQRLMESRSLSSEQAMQRIEAQNERRGIGNALEEAKQGVVTAIVPNNGTLEELKAALAESLARPESWY